MLEPKDGPALAAVASALDDEILLQELDRSLDLLQEVEPEPETARFRKPVRQELGRPWEPPNEVRSKPEARFRLRSLILPAVIVVILVAMAIDALGSEDGAPKTLVEPPGAALPVPVAPPETSGIWLVQMGRSDRVPLVQLAKDLSGRYGIRVGVLQGTPYLQNYLLDPRRHRLDGDALLEFLKSQYYVRKRATAIGITDYSMFSSDSDRPFLLRDSSNYAVVSTADLGGDAYSRLRGHTRYERTRKLVARAIGFVHFHRAVSQDPHSLLRSSMSSVDQIDALHEKL
jgi:hypothetical protein